ncbi:MAG: SOUL family heme-binding protein [Erythrobacter sp.]
MVYAQYRQTEEPEFALVKQDGDYELRDYPALVVAEVTSTGNRQRASGASFRRLAAYIFAQDRPAGGERIAMTSPVLQQRAGRDEKIAMTAPVLQQETGENAWVMRFVMPAEYSLATLPAAPDDITLSEIPARRVAAVRFSGNGSSEDLARMTARLEAWMAEAGLTAAGEAEYAFYDAPMIPGPLRRNEVLIPVAAQ